MSEITSKMKEEYLEDFGNRCPHCGTDDISSVDWDYGTGEVWARVHCYQCGEDWTDVYKLVGIEE